MGSSSRNVVPLDEYRLSDRNVSKRQAAAKEAAEAHLDSSAPIAYAAISVDEEGRITTSTCMIEPEYVPAMIEELGDLISRLARFMRNNRGMLSAAACATLFVLDVQLVPALASSL